MFSFKWPSLLSFEIEIQHDEVIAGNVRRLFHIDHIPSDTTMREIIDEIPPQALREVFTRVFAALQRGKDLEPYVFWTAITWWHSMVLVSSHRGAFTALLPYEKPQHWQEDLFSSGGGSGTHSSRPNGRHSVLA